jgi:hypothetical protein
MVGIDRLRREPRYVQGGAIVLHFIAQNAPEVGGVTAVLMCLGGITWAAVTRNPN